MITFLFSPRNFGEMGFGGINKRQRGGRRKQKKSVSCCFTLRYENTLQNNESWACIPLNFYKFWLLKVFL